MRYKGTRGSCNVMYKGTRGSCNVRYEDTRDSCNVRYEDTRDPCNVRYEDTRDPCISLLRRIARRTISNHSSRFKMRQNLDQFAVEGVPK